MRIFKLLVFTFLSITIISMISCSSENPTDNTQQGDFTFLKIGNWWINENYIIDSLGNKTGNSTTDSTFIAETEVKLGKTSFKLKTKVPGGEDVENYCYTEGEIFYMHSDFINQVTKTMLKNLPAELPLTLEDMWVKVADYKSNLWLINKDTIPPTEIVTGVTINGTFTISGEKGITKSITVNSKSFTAQEFKLIFKFEGYVNLIPGVPQTFTITVHSWFDKKVGILLQTYDESRFAIGLFGNYTFEGYEKKIIRYNVQ